MGADFADRTDYDNAERGLVARLEPGVIRAADGRVVYDADAFAEAVAGECPESVHPSLWRQCQLTSRHGLFEVCEGIYQIRGIDLSNMTLVEGERGVIVIDPLVSAEVAAAGLALYRAHRGDRPVAAVIYSHSHLDHFGGVLGVLDVDTAARGDVPVIAPAGFLEHAVSENVYAGTAMLRRGIYYAGLSLPLGATGVVGIGLGPGTSRGSVGLIAPTVSVERTGQEQVVDGVRIAFQLTPGPEAPSEMNFYFPDHRALCLAENVTHNLHNLLTLRGAEVRDARGWSRYIAEAIELYAHDADVAFASHHWPTWGTEDILALLTEQRDLYAYLHDQTLRLLNQGYTGPEIAEMIELPPALEQAWHTHGYYGSVSHNVKAIYQRYLGWYDGNPARLWQHPPEEKARRYVEFMGGADEVVAKARRSFADGDLRWAAEVLDHVVFAEPGHAEAKALLADVFEQLGYGAENGTWRCEFLSAATELRTGNFGTPVAAASADMVAHLSPEMLFDALAIQVNGPKAWDLDLAIRWDLPDHGASYRTTLHNGVLTYVKDSDKPTGLTLTIPAAALIALAGGNMDAARSSGLTMDGDQGQLASLFSVLQPGDPNFNIVEP